MWSYVEFVGLADCCWSSKKWYEMSQTQNWNKTTGSPKIWAFQLYVSEPNISNTRGRTCFLQHVQVEPARLSSEVNVHKETPSQRVGGLKCQRFEAPNPQLIHQHKRQTIAHWMSWRKVAAKEGSVFSAIDWRSFLASKFLSSACQQFLTAAEMSMVRCQDRETPLETRFLRADLTVAMASWYS